MTLYLNTLMIRQLGASVWKEVAHSDQLVPQFLDWTNTNSMFCNPRVRARVSGHLLANKDFIIIIIFNSCKTKYFVNAEFTALLIAI